MLLLVCLEGEREADGEKEHTFHLNTFILEITCCIVLVNLKYNTNIYLLQLLVGMS